MNVKANLPYKIFDKETEIQKLLTLIKSLSAKQIRGISAKLERQKRAIPKAELEKLVRQNKSTRVIAEHFHVSERTIYRRIKQQGLKGIRPRGRKPSKRLRKPIKRVPKWVLVKKYIDKLDETYHFLSIQHPPYRWINPETLVCSNEKRNPKGKFTTVGIYYIALQSEVYFLHVISIRYKTEAVPFKEICEWITKNALDILTTFLIRTGIIVEGLAAFTFYVPRKQTENITIGTPRAAAAS